MPRRDQTGPNGQGSMTGRALGICAGNKGRVLFNNGRGLGRGRGMRNGRGYFINNQNMNANDALTLEQEKEILQNRIKEIEALSNQEG